jgi:hypothetical protein
VSPAVRSARDRIARMAAAARVTFAAAYRNRSAVARDARPDSDG